jgi:tetratricopeptide (TPR) repeat protein
MKMSHLYGGILGGIVFGLMGGLLLGSCVFKSGPNRAAMEVERPGAPQAGGEAPMGAAAAAPAAGMDPGGTAVMESVMGKVAALKSAVQKNPADRAALVGLGNLYYDSGKFGEAIPYYERALAVDRKDPNLLTDTGTCYWQSGDTKKAGDLFREAMRSSPDHWQSAANLFFLAANQGDSATAREALARVKAANPGFEKLPAMEQMAAGLK